MASKRVARWPEKDRVWLDTLTENERGLVLLLIAHLDATVTSEEPDGS